MTANHITRVFQPVDKVNLTLNVFEASKRRSEFQFLPAAFGPPLGGMDAIAPKHKPKSFWRIRGFFDAKQSTGFKPWKRYGCPEACQNHSS
jgi:hypothetical protein